MQRRLRDPRIENYWTPRRVVNALAWYPETAATLESGFPESPGEDGGSGIWESGSAIERLAAQKADIDLAVARLKPPIRAAIIAYYLQGHEQYSAVGRQMRVPRKTAEYRVQKGVEIITRWLCGRRSAGKQAVGMVRDGWIAKKRVAVSGAQKTLCVVDEHAIGEEQALAGYD